MKIVKVSDSERFERSCSDGGTPPQQGWMRQTCHFGLLWAVVEPVVEVLGL